jgi:hypothetical protein
MGIDRADLLKPEACDGELECPICMGVIVDAVSCPCEHTFCRVCVERVLDKDPRCPMCRQDIARESLRTCHLMNMRVNSVAMCCERRCGWYGRRDERAAHAKVCKIAIETEFVVALSSGDLGMKLELTSSRHLVVSSLGEEGAAVEHNKRVECCPQRQIRPACVVVEANGIRGDGAELLFAMGLVARRDGIQRLVFKQPTEFCTTLRRSSKELGLELSLKRGGGSCLEILSVIPGGAAMEHNSNNCDKELKRHDCIIEVNGVRGNSHELLKHLRASETCSLRVCRFPWSQC